MSRRAATLLVAVAGVLIALGVAVAAPVPYVALTPGPTLNTLGALNGKPLIQVKGHRTYPTRGNLNMVTVSFLGGPQTDFNIFAALRAWLSPNDAVVPESEIFTPGQTSQQVAREDTEEMADSQQTATAAALCQLNINFKTVDTVQATVKGMPAAGVLHPGDVISAVDGRPVTCRADAGTLIKARKPGAPVNLTIRRHGKTSHVRLSTADVQGEPEIGVEIVESFVFPFTVAISVGDIGGPSAGLMFALGIIDKITPANLTGGRFIAGTGEIEADGTVDPIGGIQQKMAGARAADATIFLTPAANCPDTTGAVPAGMHLIKVSSLAGAIADLNALKAGKPVPSC
jgi:Lon-like protease